MTLLQTLSPTRFTGFGPSILANSTRGRIKQNTIPDERMDARAMLHDHCPLTPGVYGWLDANDQICYVGKSKSLRKRLLSYFAKTPSDNKALRIRQYSQRLVWEPMSDELLALIREQELIYRWRPAFNVQGQPMRRQPGFICISTGPAPCVVLTRGIPTKKTLVFGPIAGRGQLNAAVESLNQVFRLRDCPDKTKFEFADQQQLFADLAAAKCIRFEIGTCPAPCAARCTAAAYRENVQAAMGFLQGADLSIINRLEQAMADASAACQYERATVLRDHLANLQWLRRRLDALEKSKVALNGVLPLSGRHRKTVWLLLRAGRLSATALQPTDLPQAENALETLEGVAASADEFPANILETNLQLIVSAWFRRHPEQRAQLLSFETAMEQCRFHLP